MPIPGPEGQKTAGIKVWEKGIIPQKDLGLRVPEISCRLQLTALVDRSLSYDPGFPEKASSP